MLDILTRKSRGVPMPLKIVIGIAIVVAVVMVMTACASTQTRAIDAIERLGSPGPDSLRALAIRSIRDVGVSATQQTCTGWNPPVWCRYASEYYGTSFVPAGSGDGVVHAYIPPAGRP
jgi:hypothetical protein